MRWMQSYIFLVFIVCEDVFDSSLLISIIRILGHAKAIFYYFASLLPQYEFIGVQCEQQDSRQVNTDFIRFGFFDTDDGYGRGNFCFNTTSCFPFTSNGSFSTTTIDVFSDTLFTVKAFSTENTSSTTPSISLKSDDSSGCRNCNDFSDNSDSGYEDWWIMWQIYEFFFTESIVTQYKLIQLQKYEQCTKNWLILI